MVAMSLPFLEMAWLPHAFWYLAIVSVHPLFDTSDQSRRTQNDIAFLRIQEMSFPWVNLRSMCIGMCACGGMLAILKGKGVDVFVSIYFLFPLLTGEVRT